MKKYALTLAFLCTLISSCFGQKIEHEKVFGGYVYGQNGVVVTPAEMVKMMESNPSALKQMRHARATNTVSSVFAATGGFLMGWPLGTALGGGEPNWTLAAFGGAIAGIGLTLSFSAQKRMYEAVELYNESVDETASNQFKPSFQLGTTRQGVGLTMSF